MVIATCLVGITLLSGCKKDNEPDIITLLVEQKSLYSEDEYQIEATSTSKIVYSSDSEYIASVSERGLVTAKHIGQTNIILTNGEDSKRLEITVVPKSNLYPEPDVYFGESKQSIIAKFGKPDNETDEGVGYIDYSNAAPFIMYMFDDYNKLNGYSIMVKSIYSSLLTDFLLERYQPVTESGGAMMFVNEYEPNKVTKSIALSLYNINYWMVMYLPYNTKSSQLKSGKIIIDTSVFDILFKQINP